MKRILLSLLTCSICLSAFAQIDTSKTISPGYFDKWVITPVKGMKGDLGRLNPNSPPGSERSVSIYTQSDNTFIISTPYNTKFYNLAPGIYRMMLNSVSVENVPIQKGYETRLKAGFLDVVDEGDWWLYDETHETFYTSGNKPGKFAFPIGKYQLMQGYYTTLVEIKDEYHIPTGDIESPYYQITPLEAMTAGMGKLSIRVPKDTTVYIIDKWITIPYLIQDTVKIRMSLSSSTYTTIEMPKYLAAKTYEIRLNHIRISVPIKSGQETRIKAGFLVITKKETDGMGDWLSDRLFGSSGPVWEWELKSPGGGTIATGKKERIYALLPGKYELTKHNPNWREPNIHYQIIIKDGEWVTNGVKQ